MKIKFKTTEGSPHGYLTVGYWFWSKPNNRGTLTIEVSKLPDWRFSLAVWGHEIIEAVYCKLFGVTTEIADKFDDWMETQYASGAIPVTFEGGFHPQCPYRIGHILGAYWENLVIYGTFASMKRYERACNDVMGIKEEGSTCQL